MGCVWASLGLATYRSYGVCGASLGLYVGNLGNLHVLWGVLEPAWGCMLVTNKSYGVCWSHFGAIGRQPTGLMGCVGASFGAGRQPTGLMGWCQFGAVCWQPTCLMGCVGASLRLYVGNLQVLWGVFEPVWGWQPKGLMGCVEPVWGGMLATWATYMSYGLC